MSYVLQKYQINDKIWLESRKVGNGVDFMIIELRKKSQVTIPKEVVNQLNLQEGDNLDISIKDGAIIIEPVAVYSKSYIQKLEDTVMRINEEPAKYDAGPFKSVEEAINYLEELDDDTDEKENRK